MAVGDAHVFPGFLTPVLTQLFFPKLYTDCFTLLRCFCRGGRRKYTGKKVRLNRGSNSQTPGHESDKLTTEPHRRSRKLENLVKKKKKILNTSIFKNDFESQISKGSKNSGLYGSRLNNLYSWNTNALIMAVFSLFFLYVTLIFDLDLERWFLPWYHW